MLIMLLQVSGGAEGHRREGKHGADAHEPEDQREHAPTRSGGGNGNGGATTTATAEQQQRQRQSNNNGNGRATTMAAAAWQHQRREPGGQCEGGPAITNQGRGGKCQCQPGGQCTGTRRPGRVANASVGGTNKHEVSPGYERVQGGMNECGEVRTRQGR